MPYTYHSKEDRAAMLRLLGFDSEDRLFDAIPEGLRLDQPLPIENGRSEPETLRLFKRLAVKNHGAHGLVNFLGGGIYDHVVPSVVNNLASRPEFATAYTPYQPEVSQGTLGVIFEFQTHISRLTGMPIANASMYDAASAMAESALMAAKATGRKTILMPDSVNPRYRRVVERYVSGQNLLIEAIPATASGQIDAGALSARLGDDIAGVVVQTPNYFGVLEEPWAFSDPVRESGAMLIACVCPISLAIFRPPSEYGADIVIGEGQSLGNPMSFGGPLVGFMACSQKLIRQMPGRIVSRTKDVDGHTAFVLTLQTREQHIRRAKATSNICTNQGLLATRATIYLSLLGEHGLTELARLCHDKAHRLAERIAACDGYGIRFGGPFFKEFVVECPTDAVAVVKRARELGVLAGIPLEKYYGETSRRDLLVAVTENNSDEDFELLCDALCKARDAEREPSNA